DYFGMVTKGGVDAAIKLLKAYPYEATGATGPLGPSGPFAESLQSIADDFDGIPFELRSRPGDTLGTIAGRLGLAPSALRMRNPHLLAASNGQALPDGTAMQVTAGVTPASIVNGNAGYPLHAGVWATIRGVEHQVRIASGSHTESLLAICQAYRIA